VIGSPCCLDIAYLDVGVDGRVRHPEVFLNSFVDSKDLTGFCYPHDLFQTHKVTRFVTSRELALMEEVLRVSGSTTSLRDVVEELSWEKVH